MKTLKVTLKQHTPLIHFQHDQYGATLRASEVKPKLDRFILSKLEDKNHDRIQEAKNNGWLIGEGENAALNYKIIIHAVKEKEYLVASNLSNKNLNILRQRNIEAISPTPYFAQEKENREILLGKYSWDDVKCKGMMYKDITITILGVERVSGLINYISQYIQAFFIVENFGTRQSKGFGGFEVTEIITENSIGQPIPIESSESILRENFLFCYKKEIQNASFQNIFNTINNDYKLLKSGRYLPYAKSKLMLYGLKCQQRWEKKFFKENTDNIKKKKDENYQLLSYHKKEDENIGDDEQYYYLRAVLGIAGRYEFLLANPPVPGKKLIVNVNGEDGVERFKSPITFKVINNNIYIVGNQISESILHQNFHFEVSIEGDSARDHYNIQDDLFTPETFNLKEFIAFAMENAENDAKLNYEQI